MNDELKIEGFITDHSLLLARCPMPNAQCPMRHYTIKLFLAACLLIQIPLPAIAQTACSRLSGIRSVQVQVPRGATWENIAAAYGVRSDVLFELNGCRRQPGRAVLVPATNRAVRRNVDGGDRTISGYPLPKVARVLLGFGWQTARNQTTFHTGIDLEAAIGTPVLAAASGTVAFAGQQGDYGYFIVINHQGGRQTRYAHLSSIKVTDGQQVRQGEAIAAVGTSGQPDISTPHLHFEIRYNSALGWVAEDPRPYFQARR